MNVRTAITALVGSAAVMAATVATGVTLADPTPRHPDPSAETSEPFTAVVADCGDIPDYLEGMVCATVDGDEDVVVLVHDGVQQNVWNASSYGANLWQVTIWEDAPKKANGGRLSADK